LEKTSYSEYVAAVDKLKQQHGRIETNNFMLADKLKTIMETDAGLIVKSSRCVFLAMLEHNAFYRLYYHAAGSDGILEGLRQIDGQYDKKLPLVCTITGKEAYVEGVVPTFYNEGYTLRKRTRRFDNSNIKMAKEPENVVVEFACEQDAEEISEMLRGNFDIYSELVPTQSEIAQNAKKEQIAIVRRDGKVAALKYFDVQNSAIYGIFDYVRPEYRSDLIFLAIAPFISKALEKRGIVITRAYGWRDMDNKRLNQFSKKLNSIPQDVVLYTVMR